MSQNRSTSRRILVRPKPVRWPSLFLPAALATLTACPSTSPDALRIDTLEVDGDARGAEFDLLVTGGGFIRAVAYDLSAGEGQVLSNDLSVQLRGEQSAVTLEPEFNVLGPTNMRVFVKNGPLIPQVYTLVLLLDGEDVVEKVAFDLSTDDLRDGGPKDPDRDAGPVPDAGDRDAGPPRDAGFRDGGPPRDAGPPDSGLGDFQGMYGYRRAVQLNTTGDIPAGVTLRIPVPHATLVTEGKSLDTARDLAVYQGTDRLAHAYDDRLAPNTDGLYLIARVQRDIPVAGAPEGDALALYYGDTMADNAPDNSVFEFFEDFDNNVSPVDSGDDDAWDTNDWTRCGLQRPVEAFGNTDGNYCISDGGGVPFRRTLATPRIRTVLVAAPANVSYETSFYITAQFLDSPNDILYLSHSLDNDDLAASLLFPTTNYVEFPPNHTLTFEENNGSDRTVEGWDFPGPGFTYFQRVRLRFRPMIDQPSLHFRFISVQSGGSAESGVGLDDWWVRSAPEPAPTITLGPEETR